jgi:hypothetical protein
MIDIQMYRSKKIDDSGQGMRLTMDGFSFLVVGMFILSPDMADQICAVIGHVPLPHVFNHRQMGAGTILPR